MSAQAPAAAAMNTAAAVGPATVPRIGRGFRLQYEQAQQAWVLLYPEGMVKLNPSAGEILRRCDGTRTLAVVVGELEQAFSATGLQGDVEAFVAMAGKQRWLEWA